MLLLYCRIVDAGAGAALVAALVDGWYCGAVVGAAVGAVLVGAVGSFAAIGAAAGTALTAPAAAETRPQR